MYSYNQLNIMTDTTSPAYTLQDQQSCALAFLTYLGELTWSGSESATAQNVYNLINTNIPNVPVLTDNGSADWEIVWGPAFQFHNETQENMLMVVQQVSDPANFQVVMRGTNMGALLNWFKNDSLVGKLIPWAGPSSNPTTPYGSISEAANNTYNAYQSLQPLSTSNPTLPGANTHLTDFLATITGSSVNITFTGHSLAGCMAPVMALYFAQTQGANGTWDPNSNANINVISFAGQTAGDSDFATYLNSVIPTSTFNRWNDTYDIVPLAFAQNTFGSLAVLYPDPVEKMTILEHGAYWVVWLIVEDMSYTQVGTSKPFTFPINTGTTSIGTTVGTSYSEQVAYHHHFAYPTQLAVTEVLSILADNSGS